MGMENSGFKMNTWVMLFLIENALLNVSETFNYKKTYEFFCVNKFNLIPIKYLKMKLFVFVFYKKASSNCFSCCFVENGINFYY